MTAKHIPIWPAEQPNDPNPSRSKNFPCYSLPGGSAEGTGYSRAPASSFRRRWGARCFAVPTESSPTAVVATAALGQKTDRKMGNEIWRKTEARRSAFTCADSRAFLGGGGGFLYAARVNVCV